MKNRQKFNYLEEKKEDFLMNLKLFFNLNHCSNSEPETSQKGKEKTKVK